MNPHATPERIAAAEEAVRQQTQDTVEAIEAGRPVHTHGPHVLDAVFNVVEEARKKLALNNPVMRLKARVHQVHPEFDQAHPDLQISALVDFRASYNSTEISPQLHLSLFSSDDQYFGLFAEGQEFYVDLIPVPKAEVAPVPARERIERAKAGGGVAEGTELPQPQPQPDTNPHQGRKSWTPEQEAAFKSAQRERSEVRIPAGSPEPDPADPNSRDASNTVVDPTVQGLKL